MGFEWRWQQKKQSEVQEKGAKGSGSGTCRLVVTDNREGRKIRTGGKNSNKETQKARKAKKEYCP